MAKKDVEIKELENGWLEVPFSYMVENISKRIEPSQSDLDIFIGLEHLDPLSLKINRWGSPKELKGTKLLAQSGDIIFGKRNAYLRKAAVCEVDAVVSAHAMVLRTREENMLSEFVYFFMQTDEFYKRSMMISEGSISPTIKWKILANERFTIPNKDLQQYIVNNLSKIQICLESYYELIDKTRIYKQKLIDKIFKRDNESNYNMKRLSEISTGKGEYGVGASAIDYIDGPRYLRISDIDEYGNLIDEDRKSADTEDYDRYLLSDGDIVFARTGNTTGKSYLYNVKDGQLIYAGFLIRFKLDKQKVNPRFIKYFTESKYYWKWVNKMSRRSGQPGINSNEYANLNIPLITIDEQDKVVDTISSIDIAIKNIEDNIDHILSIKQDILNTLLTKK
ncbi:restriction endonuclease subunit S [Paraclostridium sordellii]|uniref:restriction endonuclease subunit S n=1 Tax=Paraclostridium sordellii TaxID=1505 RepID=UPI0005E9CEA9|nr:restriction endonuclease subunit S [Paeniclostridium sordellii]CEQ21383.1 restriction endonuclease S subunit [[Clostridium] sordellii] [Paeniclostridium sordellii]